MKNQKKLRNRKWIPVGFPKTRPRIKVHIPELYLRSNTSEPYTPGVCPVDGSF